MSFNLWEVFHAVMVVLSIIGFTACLLLAWGLIVVERERQDVEGERERDSWFV
jgi:Mg2+/citrate symporter